MVITAQDKKVVFNTWAAVSDQQHFGELLYERMFQQYPFMKDDLFKTMGESDLKRLAGRIMRKLDISVNQLVSNDEIMLQDLGTLGSRHPGYGVNPRKHVKPMRESLLFVLKREVGDKFTAEAEDAWRRFFGKVCEGMGLAVSS